MNIDPKPQAQQNGPRAFADVVAEMLEHILHALLAQEPDDTARKKLLFDLRERGAVTDEQMAMVFYKWPGMKSA